MGREVNPSKLVEVALDNGKDVTAVRLDGLYYPLFITEKKIYIANEGCKSPLAASNHGRKIKREHAMPPVKKVAVKKASPTTVKPKPVVKPKTTKRAKVKNVRLWLEEEMELRPDLSFKEAWVISDKDNKYAHSYLNGETKDTDGVVQYSPSLDFAQLFSTYEDAKLASNILNTNVRIGHKLKRFYIPLGNP